MGKENQREMKSRYLHFIKEWVRERIDGKVLRHSVIVLRRSKKRPFLNRESYFLCLLRRDDEEGRRKRDGIYLYSKDLNSVYRTLTLPFSDSFEIPLNPLPWVCINSTTHLGSSGNGVQKAPLFFFRRKKWVPIVNKEHRLL